MSRVDRYQNPEIYEMLAAEYVLGTLGSHARKRFKRLIEERIYIRQAVEAWELRLGPLAEQLSPVQPSARVWQNIQREIEADPVETEQRGHTGFWSSLFLWRSTAFAALMSLGILLVFQWFLWKPQVSKMPSHIAVLESNDHAPMFVATASYQPSQMIVRMMDESSIYPDKDLELWCLMKDSGEPRSMGVLEREHETVFTLNEYDWQMIDETAGLAISAEPRGGSPTGKPTGPIMYEGIFVSLI